ncbi:MAG: indole-3-glycerol-phosphate synthase [Methanophagales archaeon]|nr:indole-3-glycerol-phosphate synthase [Methanophagales archaeon]MCW7072964.1 indole-3-glycerol-phosphate synthase [Methanophagales archaeon]
MIEEILMRKRALIKRLEERRSIKSAIGDAKARGKRPVIGELKRKGLKDAEIIEADAAEAARGIEEGGACAVSVLTEEAFSGTLADLKAVKLAVSIPVLRKDFIFDEFQIMESYVHGADAILLIVRFLSERRVIELVKKASSFGLECLVEIDSTSKDKLPDLREIENKSILIGINNRDLDTLEVKLETFEAIAPEIKPKIPESVPLIAMSGIESREDATRMFNAGADALLVGTSIMHATDIKAKVRELVGD